MSGLADAAAALEAAAFRLRRAGEEELLREVTKAMRDAAATVPDDIRAGLAPHLPNRYAAVLAADVRLGTSVRTAGSDPGVSVTGQPLAKARRLRTLDAGILHHPLWGDREHWYRQGEPSVQPGWFTGPAEAAGPRVRAGIEGALQDVANRAAG